MVAYHAARNGASKETLAKIKALETQLALARKLFRVGKSVDFFQNLMKAAQRKQSLFERSGQLVNLCYMLWMLNDHAIWFGKTGVLKLDSAKYARRANQFWLLGLLISLARELVKITNLSNEHKRLLMTAKTGTDLANAAKVK
eukprot:Colp12_sorted_trinity150504_noHs@7816